MFKGNIIEEMKNIKRLKVDCTPEAIIVENIDLLILNAKINMTDLNL